MRPRMYGSRLRKWWRTSTWPSASGATGVSTSLKFSAPGSPCGREARRIWRLRMDMRVSVSVGCVSGNLVAALERAQELERAGGVRAELAVPIVHAAFTEGEAL